MPLFFYFQIKLPYGIYYMKNQDIPFISPSVIMYLDKIIPLQKFTEAKTLEELKFLQGQRDVIDHLRHISEKQQREGNILNVQRTKS